MNVNKQMHNFVIKNCKHKGMSLIIKTKADFQKYTSNPAALPYKLGD